MKKILKKSKGVSEKCSKSNNFCQHSSFVKKNMKIHKTTNEKHHNKKLKNHIF